MGRKIWLVLVLATMVSLAASVAAPVMAQEGDQPEGEPPSLTLFTRYPAQEVAIGDNVTFDLTLRAGAAPQTVRFDVSGLPEGWTTTFRGGGKVIHAAYVEPENDTTLNMRVELPADVQADTYRFSVVARSDAAQAELPIELTVAEKLPPSLSLEVELPTLMGTSDTTFRYNATLKNDGDEDMSVNLIADAPPEFQVTFKMSGQDVTAIPIAANESKRLSIEAKSYTTVPAGDYQINVLAQGGEAQATLALVASVTGKPDLNVTTPDGRLSAQARVGRGTSLQIVVRNTGSAPARDIEMSATSPSDWQVEFDPQQIAEIPAGQQVQVTANVQPADQAIAGDYVVTVHARPQGGASESAEFRITVLTSTLWGIVGVVIIAVAVTVVGLAVTRFGRR